MGNEIKVGFGGKVEPSFKSTVQQVKDSVRDTGKEIERIAIEAAKARAEHQGMATVARVAWYGVRFAMRSSFADIMPSVARGLGGLALITGSVKVLSGAMWLMEKASGAAQVGLAKFGMLEGIQKKLEGVAGGAEAAKAKVKELAATFAGTNITLGDASDAYKNSEAMTGGALSDKKGMTMLGDVATESGNGIKETSLAIGRFYDDLQAGRPIEDTANKLQDMGIISAEVHFKITSMLSEGKSGVEVWDMLTHSFERS